MVANCFPKPIFGKGAEKNSKNIERTVINNVESPIHTSTPDIPNPAGFIHRWAGGAAYGLRPTPSKRSAAKRQRQAANARIVLSLPTPQKRRDKLEYDD
jgi:hypothetical protein